MAEPTYSDDLAGYMQDIKDAEALGIDGFALNVGGWNQKPNTYYKDRVKRMFAAAHQLNTGFKLLFSADLCCGLQANEIRDMVANYANHSNHFTYNNRPVLTTFVGERLGKDFWQNQVLISLRSLGYNVFFVPFFGTLNCDFFDPTCRTWNNPTYAQISANYLGWWKDVVDGLNYFAVGGLPSDLVSTSEAYAALMKQYGKVYFAGASPYFWIGRVVQTHQGNLWRRYFDYHGGEGIAAQWNSIIDIQQPPWVMLATWNDFTESYMTPADPAKIIYKPYYYNVGPLLYSHSGYAELEKYYIQWYKTNVKPSVSKDALYYFYRTHSKNLSAPNDVQNIVLYGDVHDEVSVTTILTQPATLQVTSGGIVSRLDVPAGLRHTRVLAYPGPQSFELLRNGATVIRKDGDPIDSVITAYNFTTTSGYGYGADAIKAPALDR
jgi:glucan endo-1,3-alpha-glucosidase